MGMHVGLVAARTTVSELRGAFAETFRYLDRVDSADFTNAAEMKRWVEAHRHSVSATEWRPDNRGTDAIAFWQDGPWAVFGDPSYVLPSDDEGLAALSTRYTVLSFVVESAGGAAHFACFEEGKCRRKITTADGEVTTEGEPLAQERGIEIAAYDADESERLARAFGMSSLVYGDRGSSWKDFSAVCVVDQTDSGELKPKGRPPSSASGEAPGARKPWWKLW